MRDRDVGKNMWPPFVPGQTNLVFADCYNAIFSDPELCDYYYYWKRKASKRALNAMALVLTRAFISLGCYPANRWNVLKLNVEVPVGLLCVCDL